MLRFRFSAVVLAAVTTTAIVGELAVADDFWRTAARGLQFAGWAPGIGGGDIGVSRHLFGDGWTVQTTRPLGNIQLYGGVAGIEFSDITGQTVSIETELSVRQWLIPTARLRVATDARGTDTAVPVGYDLWFNTGVQDVRLRGQSSLEAQIDINALGFYDIDAFISNRGTFEIDGVLYGDEGTLDYDLGPVSLSGNVFIDALAAVTAPLFANTGTANPLAVFSGRAKLQEQFKQRDHLLARLQAGEVLTNAEMSEIINTSMLEYAFGGEGSDLIAVARETLKSAASPSSDAPGFAPPAPVPEPISAGWWLVLGVVAIRRRRRS